MSDTEQHKQQWRVEITVTPAIEWEKLGLSSIEVDPHTIISCEKQVEEGSLFTISLLCGEADIHQKAESIMKSFLALLRLEDRRKREIHLGSAQPFEQKLREDGWTLLAVSAPLAVSAFFQPEDLDTSLMKTVINMLRRLCEDKRNRVIRILNFLYDGLNAASDVQCYLSLYGGLNFLTSSVGKCDNTILSDCLTLLEFVDAGVITTADARSWMVELHGFHSNHYRVLKENRVSKEDIESVRAFFKKALQKYMDYISRPPEL